MSSKLVDEFQAIMDDWSTAIVANDAPAIGKFAESDWLLIGATGIFPREQFLGVVEAGLLTHDSMSHEVQTVRVRGEVAIVVSRVQNTGAFNNEPFVQDEWATEVFLRNDDGWKCTVTQLTSVADPGPDQ